jgi:lipopolysaccharide transport system permease protein
LSAAAHTDSSIPQPPATGWTTVLRPQVGWRAIGLHELWEYRQLLVILALRDIRVRYKQTVLGVAWAILQPLLTMIIFVAFFAGHAPRGVVPQLFFYTGLLPWQLFATSLTSAGNSLVANESLITKVYFPRLVMPIAAVVTALIDFTIASVLLVGLMIYYRTAPGPAVLLLPAFILMGFLAALGVGLWLAAMNVEFRDIRYIIPFLTQFMLFVTPVIYPYTEVHAGWKRLLLSINPMSGVVEGFRWCLLGTPLPTRLLLSSIAMILLLLTGGVFYFRRMERNFADLI